MSKLYSEEQVKQMIEKSRETGLTTEYLILTTPSIQLPTDEEIEEGANIQYAEQDKSFENSTETFPFNDSNLLKVGFMDGAKWMRDRVGEQGSRRIG